METDWRAGLYLPPKDMGEAVDGMPGLWAAEDAKPGTNCAGNGNAWAAWLLEADEVGTGGEKGSGG